MQNFDEETFDREYREMLEKYKDSPATLAYINAHYIEMKAKLLDKKEKT